jgi:hypothetical protein
MSKTSNQTQFNYDKAYELLKNGTDKEKSEVREKILNTSTFDGNEILRLCQAIHEDKEMGWGRAKRNAIIQWYKKKPLHLLYRYLEEESPKDIYLTHSDVISFLKIPSQCDGERFDLLERYENMQSKKSDKLGINKKKSERKVGLWTILKKMFS